MSSTEAHSTALIHEFHARQLVPLAEKLVAQGRAVMPLEPEPAVASYYEQRKKTSMSPTDFEVFGTAQVGDFRDALAQLWKSQGWSELAPLAPGLAEIAQAVYFVEDRDEEVSPFLYVMF
ncbi:hypothetical protein RAS1_12900 [Phycisphaerae bacterium RAS1]|nr:hypothetical protein RAS1_12900 [Phycisphaerae bacterium RAS1]